MEINCLQSLSRKKNKKSHRLMSYAFFSSFILMYFLQLELESSKYLCFASSLKALDYLALRQREKNNVVLLCHIPKITLVIPSLVILKGQSGCVYPKVVVSDCWGDLSHTTVI